MSNSIPAFSYFLKMQSRMAFFSKDFAAYNLDDNLSAYEFSNAIGVPSPDVIFNYSKFSDITLSDNIVIKPKVGVLSSNVFKIVDGTVCEISSGLIMTISDFKDLIDFRVKNNKVEDCWVVERFISNPITGGLPRDVKFYCFYGEIPLVLETIREPSIKRCWYNKDNNIINTGKYNNNLFTGLGYDVDLYETARKISLEIPAPFIRIDFIVGDGFYLNEFTPKPSNCDGFSKGFDKLLGDEFLKARGRLDQDLIQGKSFSAFKGVFS